MEAELFPLGRLQFGPYIGRLFSDKKNCLKLFLDHGVVEDGYVVILKDTWPAMGLKSMPESEEK